jgi:hypothetical protein
VSNVAETFDALVGGLDYPMFSVTAAAGGEREGCLVGFATQSSIDPPRFVVCLSKNNRTYRMAKDVDSVAVHMVPEDATELAELFGGETGVLSWLDCGDHEALLLEPFAAHNGHGDEPFPFHRTKRIDPGHEA